MFSFDRSDIQRIAVSATGALAVSAACVLAAVAPAKAEAPASVPAWQAHVERHIARADLGEGMAPATLRQADVALHFTADGDFAGATLAHSSGSRRIDLGAVKLASRIRYPRLPAPVRGAAQDVTMRLYFGDAAAGVTAPIEQRRVEMAWAGHGTMQVAAR